jgi:hypothetical protein
MLGGWQSSKEGLVVRLCWPRECRPFLPPNETVVRIAFMNEAENGMVLIKLTVLTCLYEWTHLSSTPKHAKGKTEASIE